MGPIIIAAVAILAAMAMRKKPDAVATSTASNFSPFRKFTPTSKSKPGMLDELSACYGELSAEGQRALNEVLSGKFTPAQLVKASRDYSNSGFPKAGACIYNVAKERLIACAPTKDGKEAIAYYLADPTTNATVLNNAAANFEKMGQASTAKCLRDFAAVLFPGQGAAPSGQDAPQAHGGQSPVPAWVGKLMGN